MEPTKVTPAQKMNLDYVAKAYGLDVNLKHIILVRGNPHITLGGLLFIASRDPRFAGCEVEIIQADWDKLFFVAKASVWLTGCDHPFEDYADSDGSAMKGGDKFRHTITRAKARALRTAFAFPFCSAEEIRDEPAESPPKKGQRREAQAEECHDPECAPPALGKIEPALPPAPGAYPSAPWKDEKKRLYAIAEEAGLPDDLMKDRLAAWYGVASTKELLARQVREFADRIEAEIETTQDDLEEADIR